MANDVNQNQSPQTEPKSKTNRAVDRLNDSESLAKVTNAFIKGATWLAVILAGFALVGGVVALPFVFGYALWYAGSLIYNSVEHLAAYHFSVADPLPTLAAASVVGTTAALLLLSITLRLTQKRRTMVLTGVFFGLWLIVMLVLALLDMALTAGAIVIKEAAPAVADIAAGATREAWKINISPEIIEVGKFIFAAIAALPIIPLAILLQSVTHEQGGQYPTMASAFGAVGLTVLKIALTAAAFLFESYFGVTVLGYPPLMAIPAATLNAIAFAMCLGNAEQAAINMDRKGVKEWGGFALAYAVLLLLIVYETAYQFGVVLPLQNGEPVGLKFLPNIEFLRALAEIGYSLTIGLTAALVALTFYRKALRMLTVAGVPEEVRVVNPNGGVVNRAIGLADRFFGGRAPVETVAPSHQLNSDQPPAAEVITPTDKGEPVAVPENQEPARNRRSKYRESLGGGASSESKS
jgi:hypothetical protein